MLRKSTTIALAAVAALGLAIGSANAKMPGPGFSPKGPGMSPPPMKPIGLKPIKPVIPIKPIIPIKPLPGKPDVHVHYPHPVIYAAPVVAGAAYLATRPVAGPCTCLSKEYTPEGVVVFKDRCTNEMAMNPPPAPPQQTGSLEQPQFSQQLVQPTPPNAQTAK